VRKVLVGAVGAALIAGLLSVVPVLASPAGAAVTAKPPPVPLPSATRTTAGLQKPVGDFRDPPTVDPSTGVRVGLAAKPAETPKGAVLVGQTATSDTYALGAGKFLLRAHDRPVNWQDSAGVFHSLDLSLVKGSDGRWRPQSAPPGASFADAVPAGGSQVSAGRTVSMSGSGWSIGFDPVGAPALSAAVSSAATSYGLGGGVSLVEEASSDGGVKEAIRLASPPVGSGDVSYSFAVAVSGVVPSVDSSGMIVFTAAGGTVVASVPASVAVDSASPVAAQSPASVSLAGGAGSWSLKVTVSGAWLREASRFYPVVVDPSLQAGRGGSAAQDDAFVVNTSPNSTWDGAAQYSAPLANYVDDVGTAGGAQFNALLKWNLAPLIGHLGCDGVGAEPIFGNRI
jgi:hypothetical protein